MCFTDAYIIFHVNAYNLCLGDSASWLRTQRQRYTSQTSEEKEISSKLDGNLRECSVAPRKTKATYVSLIMYIYYAYNFYIVFINIYFLLSILFTMFLTTLYFLKYFFVYCFFMFLLISIYLFLNSFYEFYCSCQTQLTSKVDFIVAVSSLDCQHL